MGKLLVVLLGASAILGGAWYYLQGRSAHDAASGGEPPPRTLQNARDAAQRIEQDAQRRADELMNRTE